MRCIKSVRDIADLVVYADTGSTDSSVQIAESLGCQIRHVEFEDFAQARNAAKEDLPGDWILQIDADETLVNAEAVSELCDSDHFEAYIFAQEHLMLGGNKTAMGMRLFRNRPHYRYVGCIHEMPEDMHIVGPDRAIAPYVFIQHICFAHYGGLLPRYQDLAREVVESARSVLQQQGYQCIETDLDPVALLSLGIAP